MSGYDDLERWVATRNQESPDVFTTEMTAFVRASEPDHIDLIALEDDQPIGTAVISGDPRSVESRVPWVDVNVATEHRGRGVGSALLREVSRQARQLGHTGLRCTVRGDDEKSREYLERRGFAVRLSTRELVLDLPGERPRWPDLPHGVVLHWIVEQPEALGDMYRLAREVAANRPDFVAGFARTEAEWRMYELGSPPVRLDQTPIALEDDRVVGYAVGVDSIDRDALVHRAVVVAADWEGRGLAEILVRAQAAACHSAGLRRLRAVPWVEALEQMYETLGYTARQTWLELEGPLITS